MKNILVAGSIGLLLVAGQAAAQNTASARIGDRVGAQTGEASELLGVPMFVVLIGAAALVTLVVVATDDDSGSD